MKNDRLMDEAREMLDEARGMVDDAVEMLRDTSAELQAASKEARAEFEDALREFRRQAALARNQARPAKVRPPEPPEPAADWKKTDPLKVLRVDVTGRSNFRVLLGAAFRLLFKGRAVFVFRKPVKPVE